MQNNQLVNQLGALRWTAGDLLVEVNETASESVATGYVIGPRRIITTGHLRNQQPTEVGDTVTVFFQREAGNDKRKSSEAKTIWVGEGDLDVAILECDVPFESIPSCRPAAFPAQR